MILNGNKESAKQSEDYLSSFYAFLDLASQHATPLVAVANLNVLEASS